MDASIDPESEKQILDILNKNPKVIKVDNLSSSPIGYKYLVVIAISIDGNISTFDSHKIADDLEKEILKLDKIYEVNIHINPI